MPFRVQFMVSSGRVRLPPPTHVRSNTNIPRRWQLWGEWYFDHKTKEWQTHATSPSGKTLKRGFVEWILDPLYDLFLGCVNEEVRRLGVGAEIMLRLAWEVSTLSCRQGGHAVLVVHVGSAAVASHTHFFPCVASITNRRWARVWKHSTSTFPPTTPS